MLTVDMWATKRTTIEAAGYVRRSVTSNQMYAKLLEQVQKADILILDGHEVIQLLTTADGERVIGAVAISKAQLPAGGSVCGFHAENVVLGTGGPGESMPHRSTEDHLGSTGVALAAGLWLPTLRVAVWAGIGKVRWNVSGTYQQVIPATSAQPRMGQILRSFSIHSSPPWETSHRCFLKGTNGRLIPETCKLWLVPH